MSMIRSDTVADPRDFKHFFAEVLARLDAVPEKMVVKLVKGGVKVDVVDGEPRFVAADGSSARAAFRGRWLAEHPVPLALHLGDRLVFTPTSGNRVKVRRLNWRDRLFGLHLAGKR